MSTQPHQDPSLTDALNILVRHRKGIFIFFASVMLCTAIAVVILPSTYSSEAKLLVLVGRESVSLDPVVATGKTLSISASRETEINTLLEILKSRAMLSKVVDKLGADVVLTPPEREGMYRTAIRYMDTAKSELAQTVKRLTGDAEQSSDGVGTDNRSEEAIETLDNSISVSASKNTTIITIQAEAHSPELAQLFAASLVDVYKSAHMELYRTAGSEDFFRNQKEIVNQQLTDKRAKLSDLRSEMGIGTLEAEYARLESEKATIISERNTLERELSGTIAKCDTLRQSIGSADEVVLTERAEGISNEATDGIRQQLYELEIEEGKASQTYTDDHPYLKRIRSQLALMRSRFAAEASERTELRFGQNPSRMTLQLDLEQQLTEAADLKARLHVADGQILVVLASLKQLNETSKEMDQLIQDVAFLARSYDTYSDSLEQSRIGTSLTQQQISNVNVAQPASYVTDSVSPNRMLIATGGLLLAIFGGIPLAFLQEHLDNRIRSAEEVEVLTDLPVLANLPRESQPLQIPKLAESVRK